MQIRNIVLVASLATTASAMEANPVIKHLPARAINVDGSFAGLIFKRQSSCADGLNSCGSGCTEGPCCDSAAGYACRPGEICTEINGEPGCCLEGYVCGSIRGCDTSLSGCAAGSVNDGILCCDAGAPMCSTSAGVPYCAGAAPSTVYTVNPLAAATESYDSTMTTSLTETETSTTTMDSTSNALPTTDADFTIQTSTPSDYPTGVPTDVPSGVPTEVPSGVPTDVPSGVPTDVPSGVTTDVPSLLPTDVTAEYPTGVVTALPSDYTGSTVGIPTTYSDATSTYTATVIVPYPPINGTGGNATATVFPPEVTGAAGKVGVSSFALAVLGLAFVL